MTNKRVCLLALSLVACDTAASPDAGVPDARVVDAGADDAGARDAGASDAGEEDSGPFDAGPADAGPGGAHLPRRHEADASRVEAGRDALFSFPGASVPWAALRNLWVVWATPGLSEAAYWARFAERYGFVPREGQSPYGIERDGSEGQIQCLACHTDRVAGRVLVGAGNGRLRLEALYNDLVRLAEIAPTFGITVPPPPVIWEEAFAGRTGAPGATDAFGMAMTLAASMTPAPGIERRYGFQQPPAWWQLGYKDRTYTDGAATGHNIRTMLSATLASGETLSELTAREEAVADARDFMLSLEPPPWPFAAPDAARVVAGRDLYQTRCATCHGEDGGGATAYPDRIVDVGTDPVRQRAMGADEVAWINLGWFGDPPFEDTDGYLAPPLVGVWATAPYFHNGSVPDLRALLVPSERPTRWRRVTTEDDYDPSRVGVRYESTSAADPLVYDTTVEGLGADGHDFASGLTGDDIDALLAFLVTL